MNTQTAPIFVSREGSRPRGLFPYLLAVAILLSILVAPTARAQVAGAIAVYPENSSLEYTGTRQFSAYVPISPNTIVWLVNDVVGGNSTYGTISSSGLYQPPAVIPAANVVTIKARSTAYPSSYGTATLTITRKYPWLWSVSPSQLQIGSYKVNLNGSNFAPDSRVTANGVDLPTTYVSSTRLKASGIATEAGTINFAVRHPGPGAVTGNNVAVPVAGAVVTVAVSPSTATVSLGNSQTFVATVSGTADSSVTWSVNGVNGGSATTGTISPSGLYTAPTVMPASSTVAIRATSNASSTAYAQATVTLTAPPPPVTVTVTPGTATVPLGGAQSFAASVSGSANTAVTWSVNGVNGGSATTGTISSAGVYTAPASLPAGGTVTVRATSVVNTTAYAQAVVTLVPPIVVTVSPTAVGVILGNSQPFSATVTGTANTAVIWSVNNVVGGSPTTGTISTGGLYTAPAAMPGSTTVTIKATAAANGTSSAQAIVTLSAPPPPLVSLSAARFLEQASFGPTSASLAHLQQVGVAAWLDEQFQLPETVIPTPSGNSIQDLQKWFLHNVTTAPDQLRQRVAYALSQIVVTSANKLIYADAILPCMHVLSRNAFGNYRDLLREVTVTSSMGKYLDLANSVKPGLAGGANENYPRELMQLFTIGLWELNPDGSQLLDPNGFPIPTYNQATVMQVALALTGWTYATAPGATPYGMNNEYHGALMETRPLNHDTSAKSFLGCNLPAGQSVEQDLESVIDCLMNHPNTPPFIATRLIRSLVLSNPSAGYIQRVADIFANNGLGVRGDLRAVITAILTDPEARQDTPTANQGRLKEPILHIAGFLRALNGSFTSTQQLTYLFEYMAQSPLNAPSVFSWFSPLYRVPKSPLFGPEFQIYSPTEATLRGNFFHYILSTQSSDFTIDLSPFQAYGNDMPGLVEAVNQRLLYGRMPAGMKQVLIDAATPGYDAATRIQTVLYLTALSGQYAVQH